MSSPTLDAASAQLIAQIRELSARVQQLERNQRSAYNMQNTSIDGNNLVVNDDQGNPAVLVGLLPDGTYGLTGVSQQDTPTVAPDLPIVMPQLNGLMVIWDGLMGGGQPPQNFAGVQIHCSTDPNFSPSSATLQGTIPTAGTFTVNNLTAGTTYYVGLVGVNQHGNTGPMSAVQAGVPVAVAQLITAQAITTQMLAANLIYAGIVNGTLITGATIAADAISGEILVYEGPMGQGNLIGSWSGVAGVDQFNNPFPQGLNVTVGQISGSIFSGLNFILNNNGLFFYTSAAPIALKQISGPSGNMNWGVPGNVNSATIGSWTPTVKGNTCILVLLTYTTGIFTTGCNYVKLAQSNTQMVRIAHTPFNSTNGSGSSMGAVAWLDVWASFNTPGGDTQATFQIPWSANATGCYVRQFMEFSGLGTSPSIDVYVNGYDVAATDTSYNSGIQASTAPAELWIGGVAGYYNPSATMPTITGPGAPWTNQAQAGGQIGGYSSSLDMMVGYAIMAATGNETFAGTFSAAQNWGSFVIGLAPSVSPGGAGGMALSLSAVSGADINGNQFPVGYMGSTTAIQPGSSPVLPEGWHSFGTMPSGLSGSARYKKIAETNMVIIDISVQFPATTTTYTFPVLPAGYQPSAPGAQPRIWANQGNGGVTAAGQVPRFFYQSGGFQLIVSGGGGGTACLCVVLPLN